MASQGRAETDYVKFLQPDALKGARIGVARDFFGKNDRVDRAIDEALAAMKDAGAVLVDPVQIRHHASLDTSELEVLYYELKADLDAYLRTAGTGARVRSLKDAIEFNERNAAREMPYFGQEHFLAAQKKGPLTDAEYRRAVARNRKFARVEGIDTTLAKHRLDAISKAWVKSR